MSIDFERLLLEQQLAAERQRDDDEEAAWLATNPPEEWWALPLCVVGGFGFGLLLFAAALWVAHKVVYG